MISAAANVLGRMSHLMDLFEDQISGEPRPSKQRQRDQGKAGPAQFHADRSARSGSASEEHAVSVARMRDSRRSRVAM